MSSGALALVAVEARAQDTAADPPEDLIELDLEALLQTDVVAIASRREQSAFDAPARTTVLDHGELDDVAADALPELLRRAPGVWVIQTNANQYQVGLRGNNGLLNNSLLVLSDGRSLADTSLGWVPWVGVGIHPGEVERVEILHGPGSTLYGANALTGVVNIVHKRPLDRPGIEASASAGTWIGPSRDQVGEEHTAYNNGGMGYAAINLANGAEKLGVRVAMGYHTIPDYDPLAASAIPTHGAFGYHAQVGLDARPTDAVKGWLTLRQAAGEADLFQTPTTDPFPFQWTEQSAVAQLEAEDLLGGVLSTRLHADGRSQRIRGNAITADGAVTVAEPTNLRGSARGQLDFDLGDGRDLLTLGLDGTLDDTTDFFETSPRSRYGAALVQNELVVLREPRLTLVGGLRLESIHSSDRADIEVVYRNANPRGAVVLNLDDRHAIRVSGSTAYRTPNPFENFVDIPLSYYEEPTPDVLVQVANPGLSPARMRAGELGYQGRLGRRLALDAALYLQRVTDAIGPTPEIRSPPSIENTGDVDQAGVSTRLDLATGPNGSVWGHYTYTATTDADTGARMLEWPEHIAALGLDQRLPAKLRLGTRLSAWSAVEVPSVVLLDGTLNRNRDPVSGQLLWDLKLARSVFERGAEVYVAGNNILGLGRDLDAARQYITSSSEPIAGSVRVGISMEEPW